MIRRLRLKYSHTLTGTFSIQECNVMLVFQVNCPGCFIHAFPTASRIYDAYHEHGLNLFALSTAFEDFKLNTLENTRRFVENGQLVGETKRTFDLNNISFPHRKIEFPILFDQFGDGSDLFNEDDIDYIFKANCAHQNLNFCEQEQALQQITHYLHHLPQVSYTFHLNQLPGTPTWVVFDSNYQIIDQCFGHVSYDVLSSILDETLKVYTTS